MAKLAWDTVGNKFYETGTDRGVLYIPDARGKYTKGYSWSGLISVKQSPEGGESTPNYADNIEYLSLESTEKFKATIEAYTYPRKFEECDGTRAIANGVTIGQQSRKTFGMAYRSLVGNDIDGTDHGYKIHLIYGAKAAPSEKGYTTVNEKPEAITFSWSVTTTPVPVPGFKPTALLTVDSRYVSATGLQLLEDALYGTESKEPNLPLPEDVIKMLATTDPLTPAPAAGEQG